MAGSCLRGNPLRDARGDRGLAGQPDLAVEPVGRVGQAEGTPEGGFAFDPGPDGIYLTGLSDAFVPVSAMVEIDRGAVPELVSVTVLAALEDPVSCEPNVRLAGDSDTAGAVPVPASDTLSGLSAALSLTWILAARAPVAVGANTAEMLQLAPAARLVGHVLVCPKSPAFAPPTTILVIDNVALPALVSGTDCPELVLPSGCEPNDTLVGDRLTAGATATAVPDSETLCGLLAALSVIWTAAVRAPEAVGANVTEIVQLAFTASVAGDTGQVLVCAKSAAFAPVTATLEMVSGAAPELVKVTD